MFCLVNVIARLCKCVSYSTLAIHVEDLMTEDSCFLQHVACLFFPDVCECACLIKHRKRHVEDLMTEDSCCLTHIVCLCFPDVCECACLIKYRRRHVEDLMTEDSEMEDTEPSDEEEEEDEVCV